MSTDKKKRLALIYPIIEKAAQQFGVEPHMVHISIMGVPKNIYSEYDNMEFVTSIPNSDGSMKQIKMKYDHRIGAISIFLKEE